MGRRVPASGEFLEGAFAVEVRNDNDYGPKAEMGLACKRADYFAAGTRVVWDVDVLRRMEVRPYQASALDKPAIFRRGDRADAEPALPGWSMPVDEILGAR